MTSLKCSWTHSSTEAHTKSLSNFFKWVFPIFNLAESASAFQCGWKSELVVPWLCRWRQRLFRSSLYVQVRCASLSPSTWNDSGRVHSTASTWHGDSRGICSQEQRVARRHGGQCTLPFFMRFMTLSRLAWRDPKLVMSSVIKSISSRWRSLRPNPAVNCAELDEN
jgi:hypothetical protein